jgi:hypothetical protein
MVLVVAVAAAAKAVRGGTELLGMIGLGCLEEHCSLVVAGSLGTEVVVEAEGTIVASKHRITRDILHQMMGNSKQLLKDTATGSY